MEGPSITTTPTSRIHPSKQSNKKKRPMLFHLRRQQPQKQQSEQPQQQHRQLSSPSPKKLKRTVTPPEQDQKQQQQQQEEEEERRNDDCYDHRHEQKQRPDRLPPNLTVSFDSTSSSSSCHSSDSFDDGDKEPETNDLANDVSCIPRRPRSILKHIGNVTSSSSSTSRSAASKSVHWKPRLFANNKIVTRDDIVASFATTAPDTATATATTTNDDITERWLTNADLAQLKANEKSLYRQELPLQYTTATTSQDWEDCPTAKMYLAECRGVYEWMQSELSLVPQHPTMTTAAKRLDSSRTNDGADADSHDQQQQHQHEHHQQDWSHDDFLHLILHNNPVLWNGWSYFRGMESGRMPWRKSRTRATIHTILRLQHFKTSDKDLAAAASRLTAADAMWAHFAAVGDEQQRVMEDCLDMLRQQQQEEEDYAERKSDDDYDVSFSFDHKATKEESSVASPTPSLVPIAVSSSSGGSS